MSEKVIKTKKITSNAKKSSRINIIMKLMGRGITQSRMIDVLEEKGYPINIRTLQRDILELRSIIEKSISKKSTNIITVLSEFMIRNNEAYRETWKLYAATGDDKTKARCLEIINRMNHDGVKILQSLGIIRESPIQIEHTGGITVKKALELIKTVKVKYAKNKSEENNPDS